MAKFAYELFVLALVAICVTLFIFLRKLLIEQFAEEVKAKSEILCAAEAVHKESLRKAHQDADIARAIGGIRRTAVKNRLKKP